MQKVADTSWLMLKLPQSRPKHRCPICEKISGYLIKSEKAVVKYQCLHSECMTIWEYDYGKKSEVHAGPLEK